MERPSVGDVVSVDVWMGPYLVRHYGVVVGHDGEALRIIHNAFFRGRAVEEHERDFLAGGTLQVHPELRGGLDAEVVVARARERLGRRWWLGYTCEHFVRDVQGDTRASWQVVWGAVTGALVVAVSVVLTAGLSAGMLLLTGPSRG